MSPLATSPTTRRRWWAFGVIAVAQMLIVIDMTIMMLALPSAQHELGMSDAARQWAITAYTVAFGGLLLLGGRLADRLGRRNTLIVGVLGFAVASAIGGAAVNATMLIAARAGQGVFAALLAPSALSLITITFTDQRERARVFGNFAAIMMSGAAIGMLTGGALTELLNWRWCMYINVPIAGIAALGAIVLLPRSETFRDTRFDWLSAVLGGGGIVALVYALGEAAEVGFGSGLVLSLLATAAVLVGLFVLRQTRVAAPLLPLEVVTARSRAAAFLGVAFAAFGMFLFLTFQFQAVLGYGAMLAGVAFLPFVAGNLLTATQLTGRLIQWVGPRLPLVAGMLVLAVAMALLTRLRPDSSFAEVILPAELLLGAGAGLVMPTVINAATSGVSASNSGVASAFVTTSQQVGASLGTASLNTIAATASTAAAGAGATAAAATVHGYATASGWAAGVLAVGAIAVGLLYRPGQGSSSAT